jgi:hypothetical protein
MSDGTGSIYISAEDWAVFLAHYNPVQQRGFMRYSPPRIENGVLVVDYAFSTECEPETWAKPPSWLKRDGGKG